MKALNEAIDLLSSQSGSLTDALLKIKVVMFAIGHKELTEWANNELNGYTSLDAVPEYRIIGSRAMGLLEDIVRHYPTSQLPTSHLDDERRKFLLESKIHQPISVVQGFAEGKEGGHIKSPLPPEWFSAFKKGLAEHIWVSNAWIQTEPTQYLEIVMTVRSRLLDFALELKSQLGDAEGDSEVKEAAKKIDAASMFNGAVFGNNTIVIVGDNNKASIQNEIKRGDFESLAAVLRKNKVAEADVAELQTAIQDDGTDTVNKKPGSAVQGWMKKMLGKAVDTSWQIELGIAGNLLTDALKAYYGG